MRMTTVISFCISHLDPIKLIRSRLGKKELVSKIKCSKCVLKGYINFKSYVDYWGVERQECLSFWIREFSSIFFNMNFNDMINDWLELHPRYSPSNN